jgi:hypothetical protein
MLQASEDEFPKFEVVCGGELQPARQSLRGGSAAAENALPKTSEPNCPASDKSDESESVSLITRRDGC